MDDQRKDKLSSEGLGFNKKKIILKPYFKSSANAYITAAVHYKQQ